MSKLTLISNIFYILLVNTTLKLTLLTYNINIRG